jgi:hypothetical protein
VRGKKGQPSGRFSHVIASEDEGKWEPDDGYDWVYPSTPDNRQVKWIPGTPSSRHLNVVSATTEGSWRPADGYIWVVYPLPPGDFRVKPIDPLFPRVKPTYCNAIKPDSPIRARVICGDDVLAYADFRYEQASEVLMHEQPQSEPMFRQDDKVLVESVDRECGMNRSVVISPPLTLQNCVRQHYEQQRAEWIAKMQSPEAKQEAERDPQKHIALQSYLRQWLGQIEDGVGRYDVGTRSAIIYWQAQHHRPTTGVLGDADAALIEREAGGFNLAAPTLPNVIPPPPVIPPSVPQDSDAEAAKRLNEQELKRLKGR